MSAHADVELSGGSRMRRPDNKPFWEKSNIGEREKNGVNNGH